MKNQTNLKEQLGYYQLHLKVEKKPIFPMPRTYVGEFGDIFIKK